MNTEQILKVLKNERECIARQVDMTKCKRHEHEGCLKCDLCLPDTEILEVYDFLIEAYSITEVHINISREESEKLIEIINRNAKDHTSLAVIPYPDIGESYPTVTVTTKPETDVCAREIFKGVCPYTDIKCEKWTCGICEVEKRERRLMEGDTENGNE